MILVTGGAGYIGSHVCLKLLEARRDIAIIDNLENGHRGALLGGKFYEGDVRDGALLNKIFTENYKKSVMHFAAYSIVGESARDPLKYYKNNLTGAITLLEKMIEYNVRNFVFSSTAAVYGNPKKTPILESTETNPANPYGETKFAIEKMLKWCEAAHNFHFISLRYFNACGADEGGRLGENHNPETHLIPIILKNILSGNHEARIFGADYDTPDGTCVRDYIHVSDLASAHLLALEKLENSGESAIYNLGTGRGFSVREIIKAAETVTGAKIKIIETTRRTGDPAILVASNEKAARELLFVPKITSIEKMLKTAWKWHKNHLSGFDA